MTNWSDDLDERAKDYASSERLHRLRTAQRDMPQFYFQETEQKRKARFLLATWAVVAGLCVVSWSVVIVFAWLVGKWISR